MASALGLAAILLASSVSAQFNIATPFPDCVNGPLSNNTVCDTSADPLTRARALVSAMTLAEKLNNTGSNAPGAPRIGLPPYEWWNEALHGVATGHGNNFSTNGTEFSHATSFPQPILMGAAFNDDLINQVATVVSTEARAFSNAGRSHLNFWTPNINPFKDPRWGRGQETPGEDPFHLQSYVAALIDGLQGGKDPKIKKVIATCKHFAGYDMENWDGHERYEWDAPISTQDMSEYYLPPFQTCARDSNVGAVMCSYNAVNGVPTCADPYLLQDLLRDHWNWTAEQQHVVSDCDAIQNIFMPHDYTTTREQAVAAALIAGTDINCGTYYQLHLPAAYAQGLFNESVLDQALIRAYGSLVRVGYFDPPEQQPYRQLNWSDVSTPAASQLAYEAAVQGITLLKNDGILPITITPNMSIALIGDWANATTQMQGNYYGTAPYLHSPLYAARQLNVTVNYAAGVGGQGDPTTDKWFYAYDAVDRSDIVIYAGGIDNSVEIEGQDRVDIAWTGAQRDLIESFALTGKPTIVLQMGGGQIDDSWILANPNISALLWGGYPGQSGGDALFDIITGKRAPAGRLPTTQYPADYIYQVPMTEMALRPTNSSPGRTYKWYNGSAVIEFGTGLHYTNFSASIAPAATNTYNISSLLSSCTERYPDLCPFTTAAVNVTNTGSVTSDYTTLGFLAGQFGPQPYPKKSLVAYQRLFNVTGGSSATANLKLNLGSLSRVDEQGNRILYPGDYALMIDTQPLSVWNFTLTGSEATLDQWPQPPARNSSMSMKRVSGVYGQ